MAPVGKPENACRDKRVLGRNAVYIVYKRHGRADVVHTCLGRRDFRPAIVCENCELHLDENIHASMSVAELQRLSGKEARETWAPSNVEATRQAPSKVSMEEFERKRKRERR